MTCRRLFVVIVAAMAVAACTDSGTSGSPTTAPDPTPTSAPMTTMASTTTIAVPTSTSTTTTLPRPSLALRLDAANAPTAGAVASPPWWLVADTGLGLQVARTTGGSTTIVFGEVRVAFTVDARRVVFQRAGDAAGVELYDVVTKTSQTVIAAEANRPVQLEDVRTIEQRPVLLFQRGGTPTELVRRALDDGEEQTVVSLPDGTTLVHASMNGQHVAVVVAAGGEERATQYTLDGAPGPALPSDCATAPCAAWTCAPMTDPCRTNLAAAPYASAGNYAIAFVERRSGEQRVVLADFSVTNLSGRYHGWVELPPGTIVRDLRVVDHRLVLVNTWRSAERDEPGEAIIVDVLAGTRQALGLNGELAAAGVVDPAAFLSSPTAGDEFVSNDRGLWVVRRVAEPRRLLDHRVLFARIGEGTVVAQRATDAEAAAGPNAAVRVDLATGAVRELFSLDGPSGDVGILVTAATIDGRAEVLYRRTLGSSDGSHPAGTVLIYRRALDGAPEQFVTAIGNNIGYGNDVLQGLQVVGDTVFAIAPTVAQNRPVAFRVDGTSADHFGAMTYCADGRCRAAPPTCDGLTACITHVAVAPDGNHIAWVLLSKQSFTFELVITDSVRNTVTARSVIPNNPALTLVGGIEWRTADRLIVQTFAPSPANLSGLVMEATIAADRINFAGWPIDGVAYTQQYLFT